MIHGPLGTNSGCSAPSEIEATENSLQVRILAELPANKPKGTQGVPIHFRNRV